MRARGALALLVSLLLAFVLVPSAPAAAAAVTTGQVVDQTDGRSVPGATVRLRTLTRDGLGRIVDVDKTDPAGRFDLRGQAGEKYFVELVAGRFQAGVAGGSPRYFRKYGPGVKMYAAGTRLGKVYAVPAFVRGKVVDHVTKEPLAGVAVSVLRTGRPGVQAAGVTRADGSFELRGVRFALDGYLRVDGSSLGMESGVMACSKHVVPTDTQACEIAPGPIGTPIKLEQTNTQPVPASRATSRHAAVAERLVRPGRIGQTRTGMTVAQAVATGEFDQDVANEPCDPVRLRPTRPFRHQYVVFVNAADRITEMEVFGRRPRTVHGLGVGSTNAQVQQAYGAKLSAPVEAGYLQWARFVKVGTGPGRRWIGFLFGEAYTADGALAPSDEVTLVGVRTRVRPGLMVDGC